MQQKSQETVMTRFIRFLAPLAAFIGLGQVALARPIEFNFPVPQTSMPMLTGKAAKPIKAWVDFCEHEPAECAVDTREPTRITLDQKTWDLMLRINYEINTTIAAKTDQEHWGVVDRWSFPDDGYGDCEDFQLLKRRKLVAHGLPRRALRMTVVIDEVGEGHAVLTARTDRGDFILDNKINLIVPWDNTGYQMIKMESQLSPGWVELSPATSPVATAQP